jgi:hypothetical protein
MTVMLSLPTSQVWITSSPAIKVPQEVRESMREVRQEGGGVQGESLDEALGRFYAAHNSSNAGMCGEIARRFTGQEDLLNAMLRRKYGSDLTSVGFEAGPRGGMGLDAATNETLFDGGSGEVDRMIAAEYVEAKERENQWKIHEENMQTIAKMTPEQVARAQEQIATQLSPEMIKLLTNRGLSANSFVSPFLVCMPVPSLISQVVLSFIPMQKAQSLRLGASYLFRRKTKTRDPEKCHSLSICAP